MASTGTLEGMTSQVHLAGQPRPQLPGSLYALLVEDAPDAMIVVASDGRIVLGNRRARDLFGFDDEEGLVGVPVDDLLPESLRAVHARQRGKYARHPRAREMGSGLELLGRRADGAEVPVEVSLIPITVAGAHYVAAAVRDRTEHRATAASLSATENQLSLVADRERIGRDLHDSVIQRLYGAGLAMQAALEAGDERLRTAVADAVDEIDETIAEIRTVIHDLHRSTVEAEPLAERLEDVVAAQAAALALPVHLRLVGRVDSQPPPPVADAVLAVVRECIANAHRHGGATRIDIDVENNVDEQLRVTVHDNGCGFDPEVPSDGYGLANLHARAADLGGSFSIRSRPGAGTSVTWQIPIRRTDA